MKRKTKKRLKKLWIPAIIGTAVLALGGLGIYLLPRKPEQAYSQWWQASELASEEKGRYNKRLIKSGKPLEEELAQMNSLVRRDHPTARITSNNFREGIEFIPARFTPDTLEEYCNKSNQTISEFFEYCGIPERMPKVEYELLGESTEPKRIEEKVTLYVVWKMNEAYFADYTITTNGNSRKRTVVGSKDGPLGRCYNKCSVEFGEDSAKITTAITASIITTGPNPVACYTNPPAEVMHCVLRRISNKHAEQIISEGYHTEQGITHEDAQNIVQLWSYREEAIVHALLDNMLKERRERHGFNSADLEAYFVHNNGENYQLVPQIRRKLESMTPQEVMQAYLTKPEMLFGN